MTKSKLKKFRVSVTENGGQVAGATCQGIRALSRYISVVTEHYPEAAINIIIIA